MSRKINRSLSALAIVLLLIGSLILGFTFGYRYVVSQNKRFSRYETELKELGEPGSEENQRVEITEDTPGAMKIYIRLGERSSDIAKRLEEMGVINHPTLFVILSKLNGFDGGYQYGTHLITKDMPYDEIMHSLTLHPISTAITFREGLTYKQIKQKLRENGINFDEAEMDDAIKNPTKYFEGYDYLEGIPSAGPREWPLQGYLFPDTYSFDLSTGSLTILDTFLRNTDNRVRKEHYERAQKLGMTMDQVITLASIIQEESGNIQEMYRISRVFHNRLQQNMALQSCATINFIRAENNLPRLLVVSENDLQMSSAYNTYQNAGLPPGPICNPGLEAIRAALYPSPDPADKDLLFFAATGDGTNVFSNSFDDHLVNVRKYVLPLAKEQGFDGDIASGSGAVYSSGGDIVAPSLGGN